MASPTPLVELFERLAVWEKARPIPGLDPNVYRMDELGYTIAYDAYGDRSSEHGWEFDHIIPSMIGGLGMLDNLRPLHWRANAGLGGLLSAAFRS